MLAKRHARGKTEWARRKERKKDIGTQPLPRTPADWKLRAYAVSTTRLHPVAALLRDMWDSSTIEYMIKRY